MLSYYSIITYVNICIFVNIENIFYLFGTFHYGYLYRNPPLHKLDASFSLIHMMSYPWRHCLDQKAIIHLWSNTVFERVKFIFFVNFSLLYYYMEKLLNVFIRIRHNFLHRLLWFLSQYTGANTYTFIKIHILHLCSCMLMYFAALPTFPFVVGANVHICNGHLKSILNLFF